MNSANLTRSETAARSAAVTVRDYRVDLDLSERHGPDPGRVRHDDDRRVRRHCRSRRGSTSSALAVESVTVNGAEVAVEYDGARLAVGGLTETNVVVVRGTGALQPFG